MATTVGIAGVRMTASDRDTFPHGNNLDAMFAHDSWRRIAGVVLEIQDSSSRFHSATRLSRYEEASMTNSKASARVLQGLVFCAMLVASVLLAASSASAANLTVICPGGGPGAYPSITAALSAITNNAGPNSITVSGTCTENIFIRNQNDLFIHNAPGSTAGDHERSQPCANHCATFRFALGHV